MASWDRVGEGPSPEQAERPERARALEFDGLDELSADDMTSRPGPRLAYPAVDRALAERAAADAEAMAEPDRPDWRSAERSAAEERWAKAEPAREPLEPEGEKLLGASKDKGSRLERLERELVGSADDVKDVGDKALQTVDYLLNRPTITGTQTRQPTPSELPIVQALREGLEGGSVLLGGLALLTAVRRLSARTHERLVGRGDER